MAAVFVPADRHPEMGGDSAYSITQLPARRFRTSMFRLDNKIAIITGAARGVGEATAKTLVAQGASVALADVRFEDVQKVASRFGASGRSYKVDVGKVPELKRFVAAVRRDFGRIDILVNNAAICPRLPFMSSSEDDWEKLMAINARSQFFLMQAVAPIMKEQGGGRIINIASTGGRTGSFDAASIYSGSKGAVIMFSKSAARELAGAGILINCIAPGCLDTDLMRTLPPERVKKVCDAIPLKRLGRPEEIASVIAFLASDECSYCTGATFDVNGGWLMF